MIGQRMIREIVSRPAIVALAALMVLSMAAPVEPASCGDSVPTIANQRQRIPCTCGDTVVTSATLRRGDPVVFDPDRPDATTCDKGLRVVRPAGEKEVVLDLGGETIRGKGGQATGILITANQANQQFSDNVTVKNGTVRQFGFGVGVDTTVRGKDITIQDITARGNGTGIHVTGGPNIKVQDNIVFQNGVGIFVDGDKNKVTGNRTAPKTSAGEVGVVGNQHAGIHVKGTENEVENNRAAGNGDGILIEGAKNKVIKNFTVLDVDNKKQGGNRGVGIRVKGTENELVENDVFANFGHGISIENTAGPGNKLIKNRVGNKEHGGNRGNGITVAGRGNRLEENKVFRNQGHGIEVSGGRANLPNVLVRNEVGDPQEGGNGLAPNPVAGGPDLVVGQGIFIHDDIGSSKRNGGIIELDDNQVDSNGLSGVLFGANTSGHNLKNNRSQNNGGLARQCGILACQFAFTRLAREFNLDGNSADGVVIDPKKDPSFGKACY